MIVWQPRLVNKPMTGKYQTIVGGNVLRSYTISHADVTHLMLRVLEQP